jgi:hypothetical protein
MEMLCPVFSLGTLTTSSLTNSTFTLLHFTSSSFLSVTSISGLFSLSRCFFTSITTPQNTSSLLSLSHLQQEQRVLLWMGYI